MRKDTLGTSLFLDGFYPCLKKQTTDNLKGANTLLAYFHYCNKGIYPFSDECRDQDLQTLAALDDWAIRFVHDTRRYAAEHSRSPTSLLARLYWWTLEF